MADPMPIIIVGVVLLLIGVAMKKNPNGNAFFVIGLAVLMLTIFLNILVRLF